MAISITTPDQLQAMQNNPTGDFVIEADIDMDGYQWDPIVAFRGTLDGGEYTISNLSRNQNSFTPGGLFSTANGATFSNIWMDRPLVEVARTSGALCGRATDCTFTNCRINRLELLIDNDLSSGGLVGTLDGSSFTFTDCRVNGTILNNNPSVAESPVGIGGIIGYIEQGTVTMTDCCVDIIMNVTLSSAIGISGIVGYVEDSEFTMDGCYGIVDIYVDGSDGLGLIGFGSLLGYHTYWDGSGQTLTVKDCYTLGEIYIKGAIENDSGADSCIGVGAFIGYIESDGVEDHLIQDSFCEIDATLNCGSLVGGGGFLGYAELNASSMTIQRCYYEGDLDIMTDSNIGTGVFIGDCETPVSITNCYTSGTLDVESKEIGFDSATGVGGFIGRTLDYFLNIVNCYANVDVDVINNNNVTVIGEGGLIGEITHDVTLNSCFSVGSISITDPVSSGFTNTVGGFFGDGLSIVDAQANITNCAWWTGAYDHAIGVDIYNGVSTENKTSLSAEGYGEDVATLSSFNSSSLAVYN